MTTRVSLAPYLAELERIPLHRWTGEVTGVAGLLVESRGPAVAIGDFCEVATSAGRHIRTQGRVVRVARGRAKDRFPGMGLEFIDLSPDDRAAIARLT